MLVIKNLHVCVENASILKGLDLSIRPGELHVIMGPNGSGKSTLAHTLVGKENAKITQGSISYLSKPLEPLSIEERAQKGIFMAFQYPATLPGVSNINFLKASFNALRKSKGLTELDAIEFLSLARKTNAEVGLDEDFLYRPVNDGFSGGEKKRNELLQMMLLEPTLCILDETDSGLDIDALKIIAKGVGKLRDTKRAFLIITHYQRLLNHIQPDYVHVLMDGQIKRRGDKNLALELEKKGYGWLETTDTN